MSKSWEKCVHGWVYVRSWLEFPPKLVFDRNQTHIEIRTTTATFNKNKQKPFGLLLYNEHRQSNTSKYIKTNCIPFF